jgi:hypothetical protein
MTDKWQTRPLVREGAPYGQDCNFQSKCISDHEPQTGLDIKTDRLTDCQSQSDSDSEEGSEELRVTRVAVAAEAYEQASKQAVSSRSTEKYKKSACVGFTCDLKTLCVL